MLASHQRKLLIGCMLSGLLVLVLISIYALTRPQRDIARREGASAETGRPGFSFFGIHRDTVLDRNLRQTLEAQLGKDAIAQRGLIDLIVIDPAFTQTYLPQIERYHRALNPAFGGRREHAITTLTYRRAQLKDVPFRLVRLVFDQHTGKPLYFIVEPSDNDPDLFVTLQSKWGLSARINGSQEGDHALIWRKPTEILAGISIRRRGGRIERQVRFYFLSNIGQLVERERNASEAQRRQTDSATRRAF